jgi:hypothetical protein
MKKIILPLIVSTIIFMACNEKASTPAANSTIKLPYEAAYTSNFTTNVSDSDLIVVLNSYKYWESNDMAALRGTMGDSMTVEGATGFFFNGPTDSLMGIWKKQGIV